MSDKSLVNNLEGTVVWEYDSMARPQMIVQLYKGLMKIYTNRPAFTKEPLSSWNTKIDKLLDEKAVSFILCSHQAYKTHIKNKAIFIHNDDQVKVARGRFTDKGCD